MIKYHLIVTEHIFKSSLSTFQEIIKSQTGLILSRVNDFFAMAVIIRYHRAGMKTNWRLRENVHIESSYNCVLRWKHGEVDS